MIRPIVIRFLTVLSLFIGTAARSDGDAPRPNVLFLICDDLNCDLGCYGHRTVQSPNIDRLAKRGVRFEHAYCQYPLCGPSRASFMTGLYPDQTLVHRNAIYIREHVPNVRTMSQMFRNAGYMATRVGKIFHYGVPRHIGTSGHDDPHSWDYTINPRGRDKDDEHLILINLANRPESGEKVMKLSTLLRERVAQAGRAPEGVEQIRFDNRRRER